MGKLECCLANKIYSIRKQYPAIHEFGRRIREVERELNKDYSKKKSVCDHCGRPTGKCCVKNRQKL